MNHLRPSIDATKINDKKRLLPTELLEKYKKQNSHIHNENELHPTINEHRHFSIYSGEKRIQSKKTKDSNIMTNYTSKSVSHYSLKKRSYPYAKDSMNEILKEESKLKITNEYVNFYLFAELS